MITKEKIMTQTELNNMPEGFTLCTCNDCERHETCLHWIAYNEHALRERANFYDPRWFAENGGTAACRNYADCIPIKYAIGFEHIFDEMPKAKAEALRSHLLNHYGAFTYYRYRRGEFMMPPSVQEYIRKTAADLGITTTITFRREEERIFWHDAYIPLSQC